MMCLSEKQGQLSAKSDEKLSNNNLIGFQSVVRIFIQNYLIYILCKLGVIIQFITIYFHKTHNNIDI